MKILLYLVVFVSLTWAQSLDHNLDDANELNFDVKITNVDSTSVELEIVDDNRTTINYAIEYALTSTSTNPQDSLSSSSITTKKSFDIQTNSLSLLNEQQKIITENVLDESDIEKMVANDGGDLFNLQEKAEVKSKSYEEVHRMLIEDLEPNRYYELELTLKAKQAFLTSLLTKSKIPEVKETIKQFLFRFKTTFDYDLAVSLACNNSPTNGKSDSSLYQVSSCYEANSNCTKCKSTCYEVKRTGKNQPLVDNKRILCEACPCDTSRSTGECSVVDNGKKDSNVDKLSQSQTIVCRQCKKPYAGLLCNECENEGFDYYKNEIGECMKCSCNGNSASENVNNGGENKRAKCQKITGMCIDCLFNTTGKHCHECLPGFYGDALRRTCIQIKTLPKQPPSTENSTNTMQMTISNLNEKYTYKTLALFSLYIFFILVLVILTFLCIRSRYNRNIFLKNDPLSTSSSSTSSNSFLGHFGQFYTNLKDSTKNYRTRASLYVTSLCPNTMKNLRFVSLSSGSNANTNGIYTGASNGLNDDDRLNLAEYQIFDDSLLNDDSPPGPASPGDFTYRATFNDNDNIHNGNRNPYRSLTIKT